MRKVMTRWYDYCRNCSVRTHVTHLDRGLVLVTCKAGCGIEETVPDTAHRPEVVTV